nr:Wzz/FepE/Etk N-terminal domain-containing protein [uncultured Blautia sp.]
MLEKKEKNYGSVITAEAVQEEDEIDLLEIFYALKKRLLAIIAAGLLVGCISGAFTQFAMTPLYTSMSSMLVLSKETTLTSLADIQLGTSLTSDYTVLIKSTPVLEQVIENLKLDMTAEELSESVSINNPSDTRILEISVVNADPAMAKKLVDEIAEVSSTYIGDKMEVIPPKIIEVGKVPVVRSSPSIKKNTAIGILFGMVVCCAIITVLTIMDDTIKTEDDINKYLGISVLASVPDRKDYINEKNKKKKKNR